MKTGNIILLGAAAILLLRNKPISLSQASTSAADYINSAYGSSQNTSASSIVQTYIEQQQNTGIDNATILNQLINNLPDPNFPVNVPAAAIVTQLLNAAGQPVGVSGGDIALITRNIEPFGVVTSYGFKGLGTSPDQPFTLRDTNTGQDITATLGQWAKYLNISY